MPGFMSCLDRSLRNRIRLLCEGCAAGIMFFRATATLRLLRALRLGHSYQLLRNLRRDWRDVPGAPRAGQARG